MPDYHLVSANLIEEDGKYLLVQEGKEHVRGQWNVPAGSIEKEEKAVDTAIREASEEAGVEVEAESLTGVFFDQSDYLDATVVIFVFHCSIKNSDFELEPDAEEEILDTGFFAKEEISQKNLRTPFIQDAVENLENSNTLSLNAVKDYRQK